MAPEPPRNITTAPVPVPISSTSTSTSQQPPIQSLPTSTQDKDAEKPSKPRPITSCAACRIRKVKCNKAHPCSSCIARNQPEECTYASTHEDRSAIAAADLIAELRGTRNKLAAQVARKAALGGSGSVSEQFRYEDEEDGGADEDSGEGEALEALWRVLRAAEFETVWEVVERIRAGEEVGDVLRGLERRGSGDGGSDGVNLGAAGVEV